MAELLVMYHATCARKALFVLFEKGAPVKTRELARDELREPEYRKLNPDGVVPTLVLDDGRPLVESSVIMRYLDESYDGPSLQPVDAWGRARMNLWMKLVDEKYFPAIGAITSATLIRSMFGEPIDEPRLKAMLDAMTNDAERRMREDCVRQGLASPYVAAGLAQLSKMLKQMEVALQDKNWLADDKLTLADCAVAPLMLRLQEFGLGEAWVGLAQVSGWWMRISARPAFQKLVELANPALRGQLIQSAEKARPAYLAGLSANI
jgi:glutathione S-transferase